MAIRCFAPLVIVLAAFAFSASLPAQKPAAAPKKFYNQEPYDEVRLKDGSVVRVRYLKLKDRVVPKNPKDTDKIIVRPLDAPDDEYAILWRNIESVKLFHHLILEQANLLVDKGDYGEAYDYFQHLRGRYAKRLPELDDSINRFLYKEAGHHFQNKEIDHALALLNELYARQPDYPGLDNALGAAIGKLFNVYVLKQEYAPARELLAGMQKKFPDHASVKQLRQQLIDVASELLQTAQEEMAAKRIYEARKAAYAAVDVWPLPEAVKLLDEAQRLRPIVVVAVTSPVAGFQLNQLDDWPARARAGCSTAPCWSSSASGRKAVSFARRWAKSNDWSLVSGWCSI